MKNTQPSSLIAHEINDFYFMIENLGGSKELHNYPIELSSNELFVSYYFQLKKASKKDYSYISPSLLNNPAFIFQSMLFNPDIYLLIKKENRTPLLFDLILKHHPDCILKYASDKQLSNDEFCISHIKNNRDNYQYAPESIRSNMTVCSLVFNNRKMHYFSRTGFENLIKYLPNKQKDDISFVEKLLYQHNSFLFSYLPRKYKEDPDFCFKIITYNSDLYNDISPILKNDVQWNTRILNYYDERKDNINNFSIRHDDRFFSFLSILNLLSLSFITESFCDKYSTEISHHFGSLNSTLRSSHLIIKTAFNNYALDFDITYINNIKDIEFKTSLKSYIKENNFNIEHNKKEIIEYVNTYCFQQKLKNDMNISSKQSPRIKI